jgi:hypothetical protein
MDGIGLIQAERQRQITSRAGRQSMTMSMWMPIW